MFVTNIQTTKNCLFSIYLSLYSTYAQSMANTIFSIYLIIFMIKKSYDFVNLSIINYMMKVEGDVDVDRAKSIMQANNTMDGDIIQL